MTSQLSIPPPKEPAKNICDLPEEILLDIFRWLARGARKRDLVEVQLSCRTLRPPAKDVLFEHVVVRSERGLVSLYKLLLPESGRYDALLDPEEPLVNLLSPRTTLNLFSTTKSLDLSLVSLDKVAHWPSSTVNREFELIVEAVTGTRRVSPSVSNGEYLCSRLLALLLLACNTSLVKLKIPCFAGRYLKNEIIDLLGLDLLSGGSTTNCPLFPNLKELDLTPSPSVNDGTLHLFLSLSPTIVSVNIVLFSVPGVTRGTFPVSFRTCGTRMKSLRLADRRYNSFEVQETAVADFVDDHFETLEVLQVEGMSAATTYSRLLSALPNAGIKKCSKLKELTLSFEKFPFTLLSTSDDFESITEFTELVRSSDFSSSFPELTTLKLKSAMALQLFQLQVILTSYGKQLVDVDFEDYARGPDLSHFAIFPEDRDFASLDRLHQITTICSNFGTNLKRFQVDGSILASSAAVDALAISSPNLTSLNLSNPTPSLDSRCLESLAKFEHLHRLTLLQPSDSAAVFGNEVVFPFSWLPFLKCLRVLFFGKSLCHAVLSESCTHHGDLLMALTGHGGAQSASQAGIEVKHQGRVVSRRRRDMIVLDWHDVEGKRGKGRYGIVGSCDLEYCVEEDGVLKLFDTRR